MDGWIISHIIIFFKLKHQRSCCEAVIDGGSQQAIPFFFFYVVFTVTPPVGLDQTPVNPLNPFLPPGTAARMAFFPGNDGEVAVESVPVLNSGSSDS